jgi:hypothetical protein
MNTPRQTQEERLVVSSFRLSFRIENLLDGNQIDPQCSTRHHSIAAPWIETCLPDWLSMEDDHLIDHPTLGPFNVLDTTQDSAWIMNKK